MQNKELQHLLELYQEVFNELDDIYTRLPIKPKIRNIFSNGVGIHVVWYANRLDGSSVEYVIVPNQPNDNLQSHYVYYAVDEWHGDWKARDYPEQLEHWLTWLVTNGYEI